jgi:hypothetical protein
MSPSLIRADNSTYLKVVTTAIVAASAVVIIGLTAHLTEGRSNLAAGGSRGVVVKAGSPVNISSHTGVVVR